MIGSYKDSDISSPHLLYNTHCKAVCNNDDLKEIRLTIRFRFTENNLKYDLEKYNQID